MSKDKYISLLIKRLKGEISAEQDEQLNAWIAEDPANKQRYVEFKQDWEDSSMAKQDLAVDVTSDFAQFRERMQRNKEASKAEAKVVPLKNNRRPWLWVAASALLLFGLVTTLRWNGTPENITVEASMGKMRTISLPDGTKVWLNAKSKLVYPESFVSENRVVQLTGEGYFDVTKNPRQPFTIEMAHTSIKVLGTAFNVFEDAKNKTVNVAVDEGKVAFAQLLGSQSLILAANESATYDIQQAVLQKNTTSTQNAASWKTNVLTFKSAKLEFVLQDVEKLFGRTVTLQNERLKECIFGAYFPKANVDGVLSSIASSFDMQLVQDRNGNYQLNEGECKEN